MGLIDNLRKELKENSDEKTKDSFRRFFKDGVSCYGVKTGTVGKIAKRYWKEAKALEKKEIFNICTELYSSDITEEAFVVSFWLPNLRERFQPEDMNIFSGWIARYINNWAKCDGFCNHTVWSLLEKYPDLIGELKAWARSQNRWMRRAAAVSLIVPAKQGRYLRESFEISDILLRDADDMVQKGYGWLLKEESRVNQAEVLEYVMKNRKDMPRTALRYAIELMPKELRKRAMEK